MTRLARSAEASLMCVICRVASMTGRIECNLANDLLPVTGVALKSLMRSNQGISRLLVVIKAPSRPSVRIVARGTGCSKSRGMIGVFVAARTRSRCILERWRAVAFCARYGGV